VSRCVHKALPELCGYRRCPNYGRAVPPNPYATEKREITDVGARGKATRGDAARFRIHPGFVDMTGKRLGGWTVVSRAPNASGTAAWRCRHDCGSDRLTTLLGTVLRAEPPKHCADCKPKRDGSVQRRAS
jgi:hypothetical protein